jgi:hypothetical protein
VLVLVHVRVGVDGLFPDVGWVACAGDHGLYCESIRWLRFFRAKGPVWFRFFELTFLKNEIF